MTKVKKKDWHLHSRLGFTLGEEVRVIAPGIMKEEILTIVGIDNGCHKEDRPFLLSSTDRQGLCDLKSDSIKHYNIVYIKGAKKAGFNAWVDAYEIEKIKGDEINEAI